MNTQTVMLGNLITRGLQVRCAMNGDVVAEYAEAMKDGAKFPPIIAYREATGAPGKRHARTPPDERRQAPRP